MASSITPTPIPHPPGLPLVGNLYDINPESPIPSYVGLIQRYGEIIALDVLGRHIVLVGSQKLVHELCDQTRFEKVVKGALAEVRHVAGDGLFTAHGDEESWAIAHRILVPAFGPLSIRNMMPGMQDIASQLIQKWSRFGDARIDVVDDFTKLTLDTIAFCTFSHRFNSFYSEEPPAFVGAMASSLKESGQRTRRLPAPSWVYSSSNKQYAEDIKIQHDIADGLVRDRMESGEDHGDLLDTMLKGRDPKTGKGLTPENIRYQLVTFLIAGHETTSGLLSFLFHYLLKNPSEAQAIRDEVDKICGDEPIKFEHLNKLEYIDAALKETLRLKSTAPAFTVSAKADTELLDGQYEVKKGDPIVVVLDALHRDPLVWGNDAEEFKPRRMLNGGFNNLPADAWKPFGNGMRGCIGRPFAWQESLLVVAMIFQNFDIRPHNANYELEIKTSLTIKPAHFYMHVARRKGRSVALVGAELSTKSESVSDLATQPSGSQGPLTIAYGSNAGTCKALAHKLGDDATRQGHKVKICHLDELDTGALPINQPLAIVTASYEGMPTDDAAFFHQGLKSAPKDSFKNVKYAVFGCGHPDWVKTFYAVPTAIDEMLEAGGGERLVARGKGDVTKAELFDDFDDWASHFLDKLGNGKKERVEAKLSVSVDTNKRKNLLQHEFLSSATVVSNTIISKGDRDVKRHLVFRIPEEVTYKTGDYFAILPTSPLVTVRRALIRFKLHADDLLTLSGDGATLPLDIPLSAHDLFAGFVEISHPVSFKQVQSLSGEGASQADQDQLRAFFDKGTYDSEIAAKHISLLDLLEMLPSVRMDLGDFIKALPPIRMRQYSISSSALDDPRLVTLTVTILDAPHMSHHGRYVGTATTYLASLQPGMQVRATTRPSNESFHPPLDPTVPMILIGAGSGIAPFRAFIQERALQKSSGREVGKTMLFYGCRSPETDALYDEEMAEWQRQGVVTVRYAFSQSPEQSEGCKYAQHRLYHDREEVVEAFRNGARIYVCGRSAIATAAKETCTKLYKEISDKSQEDSEAWFESIKSDRFAVDVFT